MKIPNFSPGFPWFSQGFPMVSPAPRSKRGPRNGAAVDAHGAAEAVEGLGVLGHELSLAGNRRGI